MNLPVNDPNPIFEFRAAHGKRLSVKQAEATPVATLGVCNKPRSATRGSRVTAQVTVPSVAWLRGTIGS